MAQRLPLCWVDGQSFSFGRNNHQKATLTQIFGDFFFPLKTSGQILSIFIILLGEYVARGLSAGYTVNGPVQKCYQLS